MAVATGIAPQFLLDPNLPVGFVDVMVEEHRRMTER